MKRLIVCADGTWNSDDAPEPKRTNVYKLHKALAPSAGGVRQVAYYQDGVGTGSSRIDRLVGGAFGKGLSENIRACYRFLIEHYEPGDELHCFGFSRGAYTVRSLAGLVRNAGVLRREHRDQVDEAYELYRDRGPGTHPNGAEAVAFRTRYAHEDVTPIACVGVWDTVGSLGIPTDGPLGHLSRARYSFHDVTLSGHIRNAFHALAIDERRKPFAPSLWAVDTAPGQQRVEQVWFAGVHSNVGGGYADCGLSDQALRWMMQRAGECGVAFRAGALEMLSETCAGALVDSMSDLYRKLGEHRRPIGAPQRCPRRDVPLATYESVHETALQRMRDASARYAPPNLVEWLRARAVAPDAARPAARPAAAPGSEALSYLSLLGTMPDAALPGPGAPAPRPDAIH